MNTIKTKCGFLSEYSVAHRYFSIDLFCPVCAIVILLRTLHLSGPSSAFGTESN